MWTTISRNEVFELTTRISVQAEEVKPGGLWSEYARIIGELRPKFVLVENVAALLGRGMGRVLGDLAEIGYDAEWDIISAADMGAPHLRERVWIVAYPKRLGHGRQKPVTYTDHDSEWNSASRQQIRRAIIGATEPSGKALAYADEQHVQGLIGGGDVPTFREEWREGSSRSRYAVLRRIWELEPEVGRVVDGVSPFVDELTGLGNAVVPQIPELIANRIRECLEAA
jgi:DNA (cytosine-5)-methyltransferase 1